MDHRRHFLHYSPQYFPYPVDPNAISLADLTPEFPFLIRLDDLLISDTHISFWHITALDTAGLPGSRPETSAPYTPRPCRPDRDIPPSAAAPPRSLPHSAGPLLLPSIPPPSHTVPIFGTWNTRYTVLDLEGDYSPHIHRRSSAGNPFV